MLLFLTKHQWLHKFPFEENKMEDECDSRRWDDLIPDTLGLIFRNLPLLEILTVVPTVCKSWARAVTGPYCWQEIDIEEWSRHCPPENIDRMLQLLIRRSCGSFQKLCVSGISNDLSLAFIANHAKSLRTLRLPRSEISNSIVEEVAGLLSSVTILDVSYCKNLGAQALEAIGKNCKSLSGLHRIMHPLEVIDKLSQDDEAQAIASSMPRLKHLEIAYLLVNTTSVINIIRNCRQLELLDVRGCWNVNLDESFVKKFPKLKILGPHVMDYYDMDNWDSCSDYSSSAGYLGWNFFADDMDDDDYEYVSDGFWEDDQQIQDVEMWFYDDVESVDTGYDWPQSP